jgi:hypothetical protein
LILVGLFLIGKFKPPDPPKADDLVQLELNRLAKCPTDFIVQFPIDFKSSDVKIGFLRIQSLFDLQNHLNCDHNYHSLDLLILNNYKNKLIVNGCTEILNSNDFSVYLKTDLVNEFNIFGIISNDMIELLNFRIKDFYVLILYINTNLKKLNIQLLGV